MLNASADRLSVVIGLAFGVLGVGCSEGTPRMSPAFFPAPLVPEENLYTEEKAELGRFLFYDARLSGNGEQACASCHKQALAFSDGKVVPVGSTGEPHPRNSPTLTNVAYNATLTWANPVLTELEQQVLIPLFGEHPVEMGVTDGKKSEVLDRFAGDPTYNALFGAAFGSEAPTWEGVVQALATFSRKLISSNSPFDRYVYGDERTALSEQQLRGMELFFSERLECHHCHGGFNFSEASVHAGSEFEARLFHNTGLYNLDGEGAYPANNTGLFDITGLPEDMGKFRAPTLRNVEVTAPYMHDGSVESLEEVVRFYEAGGRLIEEGPLAGDGRANPLKSGFVAGFSLSDSERADLIAFLQSLTDQAFLTDPAIADPFRDETP